MRRLGHLNSDVAGGPYMTHSCMTHPSFVAMLLSLDTFIYNLTLFILCSTYIFLIVCVILSIRNLSLTLAFSCFHALSINNVIPHLVFFATEIEGGRVHHADSHRSSVLESVYEILSPADADPFVCVAFPRVQIPVLRIQQTALDDIGIPG